MGAVGVTGRPVAGQGVARSPSSDGHLRVCLAACTTPSGGAVAVSGRRLRRVATVRRRRRRRHRRRDRRPDADGLPGRRFPQGVRTGRRGVAAEALHRLAARLREESRIIHTGVPARPEAAVSPTRRPQRTAGSRKVSADASGAIRMPPPCGTVHIGSVWPTSTLVTTGRSCTPSSSRTTRSTARVGCDVGVCQQRIVHIAPVPSSTTMRGRTTIRCSRVVHAPERDQAAPVPTGTLRDVPRGVAPSSVGACRHAERRLASWCHRAGARAAVLRGSDGSSAVSESAAGVGVGPHDADASGSPVQDGVLFVAAGQVEDGVGVGVEDGVAVLAP